MTKYKSKDICIITSCSHRQLQYWELKGYLKPILGSRNIRYYREKDIAIIKNIIELKHKGKTLGEAFSNSYFENKPFFAQQSETLGKINILEKNWLKKHAELLQIIEQIIYLEKHIPRYPYLVYNDESVEQLKDLQEKALVINRTMDEILEKIQIANKNIESHESFLDTPQEIVEEAMPALSIDQLVILWIKKNGNIKIPEARIMLSKRIKQGENPQKIYRELIN